MRTKLATCNVRNLALPDIAYYPGEKYSPHEYEQKVRWLSEQLSNIGAHLVGFQEVFHREALEAAVIRSHMGPATQVIVESLDPGKLRPRVGLATTLSVFGEPTVIADIPADALLGFGDAVTGHAALLPIAKFSRPVLRAEIGLWKDARGDKEQDRAIVYVVHLKSMTPEPLPGEDLADPMVYARAQARAQVRRTIEATGIRSLIRKEMEGTTTPTVVLGDYNAGNPSVVTQIVSGPSVFRFDPIEKKRTLWDRTLYDAVDLQSMQSLNSTYYTHIYDGEYEQLDHIMLSEEFYELNAQRIAKVEYVRLFTDHLVDSTLCWDKVPCWVSDHGWVVVTLRRDHGPAFEVARIDSVPIPD